MPAATATTTMAVVNDLRIVASPSSLVVHGKPYGRLAGVGRYDAMPCVSGDVEVVAALERARRCFAVERDGGRSGQYDHPLRLGLIIPEPGRAGVPARDDSLDAEVRLGQQRGELLGRQGFGNVGEQAAALDHDGPLLYGCQSERLGQQCVGVF